ncbi:hypothetical protein HZH68_012783 [Vespula germanica]|uniref:Uncharacterized protein n=1 Tax=Vespula germanica TaxID=30212 RepID=A0A834JKJ3_VESGE|nr:hypothetical protein HZH68_012783 [Vespula germanica]
MAMRDRAQLRVSLPPKDNSISRDRKIPQAVKLKGIDVDDDNDRRDGEDDDDEVDVKLYKYTSTAVLFIKMEEGEKRTQNDSPLASRSGQKQRLDPHGRPQRSTLPEDSPSHGTRSSYDRSRNRTTSSNFY